MFQVRLNVVEDVSMKRRGEDEVSENSGVCLRHAGLPSRAPEVKVDM